ncbi:MAG TPA: Flp pilus assembly protein CpaB [Dehalococcoidia bacterium]|nr:Flp pilus assembly protein CpaB [Dehalococcoidia bacterium]
MATTWPAQRSNSSSSRRVLLISLVFGLLSAFLVWRLLSSAGSGSTSGTMVPVVVARQNIPARTVVTDGMISVKQVPSSLRLATAFTDTKALVGKATKDAIGAGEQVLAARVANDPRELGFTGTVPPGLRAASIQVTEVSSVGGLVQPGDLVDVIGVFQVNDNGATGSPLGKNDSGKTQHMIAATILQSATVLAIAQSSQNGATQPASGKVSAGKAQADAKTVTLAVSPQDAERLALADSIGTLRLSAHRFDEPDGQSINCIENSGQSLIQALGLACGVPLPLPVASPQAAAAAPQPAASPVASPAPSH